MVDLSRAVDNIAYDPETGAIYAAAHLNALKFLSAKSSPNNVGYSGVYRILPPDGNVNGWEDIIPAAVVRELPRPPQGLSHVEREMFIEEHERESQNRRSSMLAKLHKKAFPINTILEDDGNVISTASAVEVDLKTGTNGTMIIVGLYAEGFLVCDVPEGEPLEV